MTALPFEPLPLPAGASRRRLEVFSPKLGRRLSLGSYDQWRCWLLAEANPAVTSFCERPGRVAGAGSALIDFWVQLRQHPAGEFWRFVGEAVEPDVSSAPMLDAPASLRGLPVRRLTSALLASLEIPLSNWAQILPFLVSYRNQRDALLEQSIVVELRAWTSLDDLFERFQEHDSGALMASVFWLLATGRIDSPDLAAAALTRATRFRRR